MPASFGNSVQFRGITEERGFTNPHVRFRRIRGKIVPIVNKKRIGQDITSAGEKTVKVGAVLAGAGLAKKTRIAKSIAKNSPKFTFKQPNFMKITKNMSFKKKVGLKTVNLALKATKFTTKNAGKLGIAGLAIGIGTKILGDEIQMQSPLGKDYFFISDRAGRGS